MTFNPVDDLAALNRHVARQAVDMIKAAGEAGKTVLMILPVGPLDFRYWAELCNAENVSCAPLITMNMDEYLDEQDRFVSRDHPLSFRTFVHDSLVAPLRPELRPSLSRIEFPDPENPAAATELIERHGGADICFGGMGITGHFAFNDPPEPGEESAPFAVRDSRTRILTISRESATQMAMGGVDGNWGILPRRAVTLGMYELLLSKKLHLTFMRSWHSGVMRRALFGPIGEQCPGSYVQSYKGEVEVSYTRLAGRQPMMNLAQASGEGAEE